MPTPTPYRIDLDPAVILDAGRARDLRYTGPIPDHMKPGYAERIARQHAGHIALLRHQNAIYRTARDASPDAEYRARMDANIASNERALAGLMAPVAMAAE